MIESPGEGGKRDRLSAFCQTFELSAAVTRQNAGDAAANLFVVAGPDGQVGHVIFRARSGQEPGPALVSAFVEFGGPNNPLIRAMPERVVVMLEDAPPLRGLAACFVAEARETRCGRQAVLNRLCEVIVLMVLRSVIEAGGTEPGILAGLSHPALHRVIVAIHDAPSQSWSIEELAGIAGMSRSRFMEQFRKVVGTTPMAYLTSWRLALGRRDLLQGARIKSAAVRAGYGSAAAFSRAYSREFGQAPRSVVHSWPEN